MKDVGWNGATCRRLARSLGSQALGQPGVLRAQTNLRCVPFRRAPGQFMLGDGCCLGGCLQRNQGFQKRVLGLRVLSA
jgi:hypothetical protein